MTAICIVGGGIIGASIAARLPSTDSVVLVERNDLLGGGTTARSIGMFGWSYDLPQVLKERSWNAYEPLIDSGELSFDQIGTHHVRTSAAGIDELERTRDAVRDLGLEVRLLDPDDTAGGPLAPPSDCRVLSIPAEGYLDPGEVVANYRRRAIARGVEIRTRTEVVDVRGSNDAMTGVETNDGFVEADVVINAAGPSAPLINELAGVSLPLRHNLGPILVLEHESLFSLPNTSFEGGLYVRSEGDRQAFVGRSGRPFRDADVIDP